MQAQTVLLMHAYELGWGELWAILQTVPGIVIVGEATTREQALGLAATHRPTVILTGTTIDANSALPLLTALRAGPCPTSTVGVFATQLSPPEELEAFANLGIAAYIVWNDLPYPTLRSCLLALLTGDFFLASRSAAQAFTAILQRWAEQPRCSRSASAPSSKGWLLG